MNEAPQVSTTPANDRAEPLASNMKPVVLPEIVVKLVLGAQARRRDDQVYVGFEGASLVMHVTDFEIAFRLAEQMKKGMGRRVTPGTVISMVSAAQRAVVEEIFRPGVVRVLYYPTTLSKASAFYRCGMPLYALNSGGRAMAHSSPARFGREALNYDVVVIQIDHSPSALEFVLALQGAGKRVVYEIDDAFDCLEPWHPQYAAYGQPARQEAIRAMMAQVDAVQVSTAWLAERYAGCAKRIEVVPNMVELSTWPRADRLRKDGLYKVLWAGSPSHSGDLEGAVPALGRFARAHPEVRIVFFGQAVKDERIPASQVETIPWCEFEEFPFKLAEVDADVAIAPLADIPFNLGKSNLRVLQYWATGYPVIASSVRPYADTVLHGRDGILVKTEEDWLRALDTLYGDRVLAAAYSKAGFESVKPYDVPPNAKAIEAFYTSLSGR